MNAWLGWGLALAAMALGGVLWGAQGMLLALSVTVFWLLLQFSRAMRALRAASAAPVGQVPSVVMLHARLRRGQRLMEVLAIARSLGQKLEVPGASDGEERFAWMDPSGARLELTLRSGRVADWALVRPPETPEAAEAPPSPAGAGR